MLVECTLAITYIYSIVVYCQYLTWRSGANTHTQTQVLITEYLSRLSSLSLSSFCLWFKRSNNRKCKTNWQCSTEYSFFCVMNRAPWWLPEGKELCNHFGVCIYVIRLQVTVFDPATKIRTTVKHGFFACMCFSRISHFYLQTRSIHDAKFFIPYLYVYICI